MRAGPMKYKLTLMQPTVTVDTMGARVTTYTATNTVWAERDSFTGKRSEETSEHFADYSALFLVRDAHEVDENWRVQQLGGNLYTVTNVTPNIDKGYLELKCERVNE